MNFKNWLSNDQIYTSDEILPYTAPNDLKSISEWMNTPLDQLKFIYKLVPMSTFDKQAKDMLATYDEFPKDRNRTDKINKLLKNNKPLYPIFVEYGDRTNFILEGRHRIVSFLQNNIKQIPVFYVIKS